MLKKAGWLDSYSYKNSVAILKELALTHASQAGPKHSAPLQSIIAEERWADLLGYKLSYADDDDVNHLIHARQALGFFQKFEPLKWSSESKTLRAFRKFVKTELDCQRTNDRFSAYRAGTPMGYPFDVILTSARSKMASILGDPPPLSSLAFGFGPGANVNIQKKHASFRVKLGEQLQCSHELSRYLRVFLQEFPELVKHHGTFVKTYDDNGDTVYLYDVSVEVVEGRLQFVPKSATEFRIIIVEPGLNTLAQQGYGKEMRMRFKKYAGIDLDRGGSINRELAKVASMTNHLATVDFSSASDCCATQMVAFVTPDKWFTQLDLVRTRSVNFEGLTIHLEKFSTMGNSFTFELESIIFYSLAWAVCRFLKVSTKELRIFGDDLILPVSAVPLSELVFAFCGLTINSAKSFSDGPFRESCGGDYFKGIDIRPYYQKTLVSAESLFSLHNHYMRGLDLQAAARVLKWIHPDLIIFGPDGYGDGHLIGSWNGVSRHVKLRVWDPARKRYKKTRHLHHHLGWEGTYFKSYRHIKNLNKVPHSGDPLLPAFSIYVQGHPRSVDELEELLDRQSVAMEPRTQGSPQERLWADPKYFTVPGSRGYEVVLIYTAARGVLIP